MSSKDLLKSILESFYGNGEHCISYLSLTDRLMNEVQNVLDDDVVAIDLKYDFEPLKPFLEIVKEEKPEIIVLTGDLVDCRKTDIEKGLDYFANL